MRTYSRKKQEVQEIEDVQSLCRLCLERSEEIVPIFDTNAEDLISSLSVRIAMCLGLEVSRDDALPKNICHHCNTELEKFYTFKKNCAASYRKLKAFLGAFPKVNPKKVEDEAIINTNNTIFSDGSMISNEHVDQLLVENGKIVAELNVVRDNGQMTVISEDTTELGSKSLVSDAEVLQDFATNCLPDEVKHDLHIVQEPTALNQKNDDSTRVEEDLSEYMVTSLMEKGFLAKTDDKLDILNQGLVTINLETACGSEIVFEMVEEDPEMPTEGSNKSTKAFDSSCKSKCCGTCGLRLSSRGALLRHQRVHTGERPFPCRACGRRFTQREVLRRHELTHADKLPYQCAWCPKSYTQRGGLAAHARTHEPPAARPLVLHRCSRCPKVFLYPSGLSRHMSVHQGRDFSCDECARTFKDKSSLRRHRRAHQRALAR